MTSLVQNLFARRPTTPAPSEADGEPDREAKVAEQIRFLREQELRRARTSVPPPRR